VGDHVLKALASGGTAGTSIASDRAKGSEGQRDRFLPDGRSIVYRSADGLKQVNEDGTAPRLITHEQPLLWDLSPDGRLIYAMVERDKRAMGVSPDGTRLIYAYLKPEADIWILEGFAPPARSWWKLW